MRHETNKALKEAEEILKKIKGKPEPKFKFKEIIFSELNKPKGVTYDRERIQHTG